ncbi:MAG: hypothetical protein U9Q70_10340 [Chloroflexota bacterium]|nr:hypothetical protein [Chloroflexota bacterium]
MRKTINHLCTLLLLSLSLLACTSTSAPAAISNTETPVSVIPLSGPASRSNAEISGLAWYGEHLILLPQYPARCGHALYTLSRQELLDFLDGAQTASLEPRPIPFHGDLPPQIHGSEGFEALTIVQEQLYLTVESKQHNDMLGYLVTGTFAPDMSAIELDTTLAAEIPPQAALSNMSDESLLFIDNTLLTFYEAHGSRVNPAPVAHRFATETLEPQSTLPFPALEYRLTDVTAADDAGRFWGLNYLWPGDSQKLAPAPDPLTAKYGAGATHAQFETVERLVEFQYHANEITLVEQPPLQLELLGDDKSRNWEGLVRLEPVGFLLITDKHPETILGFVAHPTE